MGGHGVRRLAGLLCDLGAVVFAALPTFLDRLPGALRGVAGFARSAFGVVLAGLPAGRQHQRAYGRSGQERTGTARDLKLSERAKHDGSLHIARMNNAQGAVAVACWRRNGAGWKT